MFAMTFRLDNNSGASGIFEKVSLIALYVSVCKLFLTSEIVS